MAQDDDSFGLPDLNFKPLEPKPETPPPAAPKPAPKVERKPEAPRPTGRIQTAGTPNRVVKRAGEPEEEKSSTSVVIGILVPILILVGGYFAYIYLYKKPKEKAAIEAANKKKEENERKAKATADSLARVRADEEARLREAANAKPAIGTIETLTAATGRFYVIAASSIDDDLIMDEAQRMSTRGISSKIIPPFGKWKFFRLTISDQDTFALAQAKADEIKGDYPGGLWVMRY